MSYFSTQLEIALNRCDISRPELAQRAGIIYGTLANYAGGRRSPDVAALRSILAVLPKHEAALLLMERLRDEIPAEHADLILIEPRAGTDLLGEPVAEYAPLPPKLEEAIGKLRAAVRRSPEWADIVMDIAKVL